jgi:hypothetical protein
MSVSDDLNEIDRIIEEANYQDEFCDECREFGGHAQGCPNQGDEGDE